MALDSFVGDGLNPSPYREAIDHLRATVPVILQAFHCLDSVDNRELTKYELETVDMLNKCYGRIVAFIGKDAP